MGQSRVVELCLLAVCLVLDVQPFMQDERAHQRVRVFGETEVSTEEQALCLFPEAFRELSDAVFSGQHLLI